MIDLAERQYPNSSRKRAIQKALTTIRDQYVGHLATIIGRRSKMDDAEIRQEVVSLMTTSFMIAARLGLEVVGLSGWELNDRQISVFAKIVEVESEFFIKWLRDMKANEAMGEEQRLGLYGGAIAESFWTGWVQGLPSTAKIWWRLGIAEHCESCLTNAARSPFTKPGYGDNPLKEVPRSLTLICGHQCKCFLEAEIGEYVRSGLINTPGVEVTAIGDQESDPNSLQALIAARYYQRFAERYVWHRRMDVLNAGAGHELASKQIIESMKDLADRLGHAFRLTMTVSEILGPIDIARAVGFRFVRPTALADELIGVTVLIILLNGTDRGSVTAVGADPPIVELENDPRRIYRLDETGGAILFVER